MSVRRWNALHLAFPLRCKCGLHARQVTLQDIDAREGYPTSSLGLPMCNEPMKTGSCTGSVYALNAAAKLMLQAVSQHMNSITTQHQTSSLQRSRYAHIRAATGHASPQVRVMSLLSLQSDQSPGLASPTLPRPNSKGKLALLLPVKKRTRSGPLYCCTRFNCSCVAAPAVWCCGPNRNTMLPKGFHSTSTDLMQHACGHSHSWLPCQRAHLSSHCSPNAGVILVSISDEQHA